MKCDYCATVEGVTDFGPLFGRKCAACRRGLRVRAVHYNEYRKRETYTLANIPFRIIEATSQES